MPQDRRWERRRPMRPGLFAARQVYVRSGASSRYVDLSRSLQICVAVAMGVAVLWLGLASYAAVAKHLETLEQRRELARLESIAKTLRTTVEDVGDPQSDTPDDAATNDLEAELAAAKAGRERALTLADARAAEAADLRRELALANERISELTAALAQAKAGQPPILDRIASLAADAARPDAAATAPGGQPACPTD